MRDVIPVAVYESIRSHLVGGSRRAEQGWEAGADEEDTLTGDLGANLRREWSHWATVDRSRWRWRTRYKKFRGRGHRALESLLGADGIVQVEVDVGNGITIFKGILFQAKKYSPEGALGQVRDMESVAPEGSAVFVYGPRGYHAERGRELIERADLGFSERPGDLNSLGSFLGDTFLACQAGIRGMYYDGLRKILVVPLGQGDVRMTQVAIIHRIAIEVERVPIRLV